MALAIGFAPHTGWALAVVVDGHSVVDRLRLDLEPEGVDRQVFHAAAGRADAEGFVAGAIDAVHAAAARAVAGFDVAAAGICRLPRELPELAVVLARHTLQHAAEGELYRAALEDACAARGWPVAHADPKSLRDGADTWKGAAPPPWQAEHRLAAAIALRSVRP